MWWYQCVCSTLTRGFVEHVRAPLSTLSCLLSRLGSHLACGSARLAGRCSRCSRLALALAGHARAAAGAVGVAGAVRGRCDVD